MGKSAVIFVEDEKKRSKNSLVESLRWRWCRAGSFSLIVAEKVCDPQSALVIDVEACREPCAYLVLNAELKSVLNCESHPLIVQDKLLVSNIIFFLCCEYGPDGWGLTGIAEQHPSAVCDAHFSYIFYWCILINYLSFFQPVSVEGWELNFFFCLCEYLKMWLTWQKI